MAGWSAKRRATLHLRASTLLDADAALHLVKETVPHVVGAGMSLLTSGIGSANARVNVTGEQPGRVDLSISAVAGTFCTFEAAAATEAGRTLLTVGPLSTYATSQEKLYGIPATPKTIAGMDLYRRFLDAVHDAVAAADGTASIRVTQA
ncbi:MAG: hypothetical protein QM572_01260 [Nocardioides sp.]|uniref:hypothetical protein n=1 Tax=Nocardioides sp. TaxID=35761 RepID=UPI0039E48D7F